MSIVFVVGLNVLENIIMLLNALPALLVHFILVCNYSLLLLLNACSGLVQINVDSS